MNRTTFVSALAAMLIAGAALGYWLASGREARAPENPASERQVLYWYDPMKPDVKFDKPGPSPFMDMPLVPRYADEEKSAAVRIDPAVVQNLGIRTAPVQKVTFAPRLTAVGSVAFDDRLLETVAARVDGTIVRLYVKAPLERVRRGQPLAEIVAPQWRAAEEEYLALLDAESDRARDIRAAARERLAVLGVPEGAIRRLEATRRTGATTTLVAPVDGVMTELAVREGSVFLAGAPLFRVNGLGTVWVEARIPEAQAGQIPAAATVRAHAAAWPGVAFDGKVEALLPDVDRETRTLPVRITIANPDRRLAPGMFVSLEFDGGQGEPRLVVPSEALIVTGARSVVVVKRDGGFAVADVTAGAESGGMTEILSGLSEGEAVVVSGQFLIDSEANLRSAATRLEEPHTGHGAHP